MIHRSRRWMAGFIVAVALLLVVGVPLHAQPVGEQFLRGSYNFTGDTLEILHAERRAVLTGDVEVWNDTSQLLADRLVVHYLGQGDTIETLEAFGNVEITHVNLYSESDYARYETGSDTLVLRGDAYIKQGSNEYRSAWMSFNFRRSIVRMRRGVRGNVRQGIVPSPTEDGGGD